MAGRVAVVLLLLVFAGCGAFGGAERQTVTPVPVPEQSQDDRVEPALTENTVDARRLAAAHRRATWNRSYVLGMRLSLEWGTQIVNLVVEDRYHYQFRTEILDQNYTKQVYTNGNRRYVYDVRAQGAWTATRRPTPVSGVLDPDPARLIEAYLATNVSVERPRDDCDTCRVTLTATDPPAAFEPADNYSARATVRPDGLVRSLTVSYWDRSRNSLVSYEIRYSAVGETTVSRPTWVRKRWGNATDSDPELSDSQ
ncbi:hypothetical protein HISP_03080 [Haloarcula hispanica N601]|uniref:Uncharacterized protein n=2 Tax=Haloarcula hispanica TaxID=51589 RepID=V5TJ75_HALHI|nr:MULTISPECIES: hypothetical protein [Haloarcula]AEM56220.1 conserved hypothetical protein [Haloarcula hispanica ATCC 33960]AHB65032.1 hypothetical protein HISP_03080 [Haloarcula hispanica N601]KZX48955.1 hypothetical protein AV929_18680 [Haloarcula sp. K1]